MKYMKYTDISVKKNKKYKTVMCILAVIGVISGCGNTSQQTLAEINSIESPQNVETLGQENLGDVSAETEQESQNSVGTQASGQNVAGAQTSSQERQNTVNAQGNQAVEGTNAQVQSVEQGHREPVKVKGIYVSGPIAGNARMDELIELVDTTELNAMVIDIKNDDGRVTYKMDSDTLASQIGASINYVSDMKELVQRCKEKNIYLSVCLQTTGKTKKDFAIIALPVQSYGRFIRIPGDDDRICLMFLDDIVRFCLPLIFNGRPYDHFEAYTFKFTKDAEMELDSDLRNSIMQKISKGVKSRKNGEPIRLVYDSRMPAVMQRHLSRMLCMDRWDTQVGAGRYQNLKDLMKFPDCKRDDLKYPPQPPLFKTDFSGDGSILNTIRTRDLFLHYPYHSFSSFLRVLREATIDPNVKAIKMTLYRVAKNSKVIQTLIAAARNGKKVTVVIELLARFDEASNISWSKQMQDAGIKVVFGVEGLKIHAKLVYISGRQGDIACVSTGNFHEGNATRYTDVTLFTARKTLVKEVRHVFDFIEKPYLPVKFKELLVSPNDMRSKLLKLIEEEVKNARKQKTARILGKVNHITDRTLIAKLYEASAAGVKIDLVVRGNCSIVTGIPGISENIRINGIIDRYLEHSRIFIFENAGDMICLTGSADWMPRNLDNRIEVLTPVYDKKIQTELKRIVEYGLKDSLQGRQVDGTGQNIPWKNEDHSLFRSQSALYHYYQEDIQEITTNNIPHE